MQPLKKPAHVDAILWDFDGTIADSAAKTIAITKKILSRVAPRLSGDNLPRSLQSQAEYHTANHGAGNWRELYRDFFGMTDTEIDIAGPLWESYQMKDETDVTLFDGVADTVNGLSAFPQGICSANATQNIRQILQVHGLHSSFKSVIGYEELPEHQQKPEPEGGLRCLREIFGDTRNKTVLLVGDHIADVIFARGLRQHLAPSSQVISVVVTYSGAKPQTWQMQPDIVVDSPMELRDWIQG